MIGIEAIGVHIPKIRISNLDRASEFSTNRDFIKNKIGPPNQKIKTTPI